MSVGHLYTMEDKINSEDQLTMQEQGPEKHELDNKQVKLSSDVERHWDEPTQ